MYRNPGGYRHPGGGCAASSSISAAIANGTTIRTVSAAAGAADAIAIAIATTLDAARKPFNLNK
jgi:hydroxymethylpyrimidine/phosphomethylpyrimidine kinase